MTNLQKLWAPLPCVLRRESKLLYISFSWMDVVMSACVNYFSPNSASCWRQGTSPQVYNSENYNSLNAKIKCFSSTHLLKRRILFHIYKSLPLFAILDNFYKTDILFFFYPFLKKSLLSLGCNPIWQDNFTLDTWQIWEDFATRKNK